MALSTSNEPKLLSPTELFGEPSPLALTSTTSAPLLSLPPELLFLIADHLPPAALVALKLTHPHFNRSLRINFKFSKLDPCASFAIYTFLGGEYPSTEERAGPDTRHRCVICKQLYTPSSFGRDAQGDGVGPIELPERVCMWHKGRFAAVRVLGDASENEHGLVVQRHYITRTRRVVERAELSPTADVTQACDTIDPSRWISKMETLCCHCGNIKEWRHCGCDCETCGVRPARTYVRYVNGEDECRSFSFEERKGAKGVQELWAMEKSWAKNSTDVGGRDRSPGRITIKYVPVEYVV